MPTDTRLQVVFEDLRRAIDDVIGKHQVTLEEVMQTIGWIQQVADAGEFLRAAVLFGRPALEATEGATYAHPEKDGASHWQMEGPAHVPGAPAFRNSTFADGSLRTATGGTSSAPSCPASNTSASRRRAVR